MTGQSCWRSNASAELSTSRVTQLCRYVGGDSGEREEGRWGLRKEKKPPQSEQEWMSCIQIPLVWLPLKHIKDQLLLQFCKVIQVHRSENPIDFTCLTIKVFCKRPYLHSVWKTCSHVGWVPAVVRKTSSCLHRYKVTVQPSRRYKQNLQHAAPNPMKLSNHALEINWSNTGEKWNPISGSLRSQHYRREKHRSGVSKNRRRCGYSKEVDS